MAVIGTVGRLQLQLKVGIPPSFNRRERMNVIGTVGHLQLQLEVGISLSSNG